MADRCAAYVVQCTTQCEPNRVSGHEGHTGQRASPRKLPRLRLRSREPPSELRLKAAHLLLQRVGNDLVQQLGPLVEGLLGAQRDHCYAIVLEPVAHDRTREHVHLYYAQPDTPEAMRHKNAALWKGVFIEDVVVVEGMQKGRAAPGFDGGRFSPAMDGPTHLFHAWVAERLAAHREGRDAG